MSKDTRGNLFSSLAVVVFMLVSASAVASPTVPTINIKQCHGEVATAAAQPINMVSAADKNAKIDAKLDEVEYDGKSSSVYLIPASSGGPDTVTAGQDVWVAPVHRVIGKAKETFVIEATTQTNRVGECRVLSMTIVDHITGR